jgi:hypothetical protein
LSICNAILSSEVMMVNAVCSILMSCAYRAIPTINFLIAGSVITGITCKLHASSLWDYSLLLQSNRDTSNHTAITHACKASTTGSPGVMPAPAGLHFGRIAFIDKSFIRIIRGRFVHSVLDAILKDVGAGGGFTGP